MMITSGNFFELIAESAKKNPDKLAVKLPKMLGNQCVLEEDITYKELLEKVGAYQHLWKRYGLKQKDRVIIISSLDINLYLVVMSLLASGLVPVMIDMGMKKAEIKAAIQDSRADACIGMKSLLRFWWVFPTLWRMKRFAIDGFGFGYRLLKLPNNEKRFFEASTVFCDENATGMITFTSGSTGRPKGANRTHYSLIQQYYALVANFPETRPTDIDLTCFPVAIMGCIAKGVTCLLPRADLAKIASVDPPQVIDQIESACVTRIGSAPAFLNAICTYLINQGRQIVEIERVAVGGATVPQKLVLDAKQAFPNAQLFVLYGSTESEPISVIAGDKFLERCLDHKGYLVGKPVSQVKLIIADLGVGIVKESELKKNIVEYGEIGEILVSGDHVLKDYIDNPEATSENKIHCSDGTIWHRTGDTGFKDADGYLWLTGRVKDRIYLNNDSGLRVIEPFVYEKELDAIFGIERTALISYQSNVVLFVKPINTSKNVDKALLKNKISSLGNVVIYVIEKMPFDRRHNSKINRPLLRQELEKAKNGKATLLNWSVI